MRLSSLFLSPFESTFSDNASIGIHPFGDEAYSLAEIPFAHRINLENLETLETVNVHNVLGLVHHTAHLHTWADKVYNIGSKLGFSLRPCYVVVEMDATSKLTTSSPFDEPSGKSPWSTAKIVATIPSRWPLKLGYMHSFLITPNYFILVEQPLSIFMPKFAVNQLSRRKPLASSLQFFPDEDTCFYVVSRNQANNPQCQVFRAPAFIYFHTINAFETKIRDDDDIIIVDISCYDDPSFIDSMYVEALENAQSNPDYAKMLHGRPKRFTLNCTSGQITESKVIVNIGCELPKINSEFVGKPYNYFYAMCADIDANNPGKLIKVDVVKNTFKTWHEPNAFTSEPIFVPAPNSKGEDDGVLMSILLYGGESRIGPNRSTLVILHAKSWEAIAKVDILSESALPKCLHGWFFPDEHFKETVTQDKVTVS
ncbi:Carotenoid isomerooxygenase [Orchesella cincta]|uniref:Carotenoid isomerooxygenase n=1 Tax=Orchesella cincta TaxID=48709 RepID=A0A1D2MCZ4_ORCCI|nr:Carotenoid isomerooxygenase [Orchesella cincta]